MGPTSTVALAFNSATSSFTPHDDKQNKLSPSLITGPFRPLNVALLMDDRQQDHPSPSAAQPYLYPGQLGYASPVLSDHTSGQDTSTKASSLLDTRQWTPFPSPVTSYATSGIPFMVDLSLHDPPHVISNGFTGSFSSRGALAHTVAPESQVIPDPQAIPDSDSSSTSHYHASLGTDPGRPAFSTGNVVPSSFSGPTEHTTNVAYDERLVPVVIYWPPEKKGPGRGRSHCACPISVEGLRIDKDDLNAGVGQGSGAIIVYECRWAKSTSPCEMWIIGTRSRVGAHIRKWHSQSLADGRVTCLWDGCTAGKAMLKGSINRHVLTVHLEEVFHCQGCKQEFSRKDVYDKHVESGIDEVCKDAGAVIVYGTESRVIDTRQALQRDTLRYVGR